MRTHLQKPACRVAQATISRSCQIRVNTRQTQQSEVVRTTLHQVLLLVNGKRLVLRVRRHRKALVRASALLAAPELAPAAARTLDLPLQRFL